MKNITYEITRVIPEHHQIEVRYSSKGQSLTTLITLTEVPAPTGAALEKIILDRVPSDYLKLLADIADPSVDTSMEAAKALLGQEVTRQLTTPDPIPMGTINTIKI